MDIINQLWCNGKEKDWKEILESYKYGIKEGHHQIEKEMQNLKFQDIKFLSTREFQNWLCNKFFYWQHTSDYYRKNAVNKFENFIEQYGIEELACYQKQIFDLDLNNISKCLDIVMKVGGIGIVGATGLLSVLYPEKFGTVNRDTNNALSKIKALGEHEYLNEVKNITLKKARIIIEIYRKKAEELNKKYKNQYWTPRKIDMVLWTIEKNNEGEKL